MSISGEIDRIRNNVQNTLGTIAETGVNVSAGANSNALPAAAAALANEKQNKLTGTKGHIVGFDASGNAVAQLPANIAIGTCITAAETAEKVITITSNDNWTLMAGCIIVVKFSATNTASNPTFNVNGTGAKSVWYNTALITTGSLSYAGYANRYGEYAYDGTQFVFVGWSTDSNSTYSNASLGQGYGTCSTAAATAAKTVSLSSYALTKGGVVAVKFTYAVPANATLNINSKGAKNIYYRGAKIIAGIIEAGDIATFIYDGTQYHLLTIDSLIKAKDAVLFSAQSLTAAQQTQARTNIGAQAKLVGAAGQVVGFDARGNAIAQDAPSGGGVSSWNDLTDKPTEIVGGDTLTWDGDITGLDDIMGDFFRVSDAAPTMDEIANGAHVVVFYPGTPGYETRYESVEITAFDMGLDGLFALFGNDNNMYGAISLEDSTYKRGTYLLKANDSTARYVSELTLPGYTGFAQEKLKPEVLPEVLWNSVIVKSSTPGSDKHFRITVDDNGTISAVEV